MSRLRQVKGDSEQDWDTFLAAVDDRAKDMLSLQSGEVIQAVMAEGPLVGSNPSAILMGRVRKAKDAMGAGGKKASKSNAAKTSAAATPVKAVVRGGRPPQAQAKEPPSAGTLPASEVQALGEALSKL